MLHVFQGFTTAGLVIAVGWLLARTKAIRPEAQAGLREVAYLVGQPAVVLTVIAGAQLDVLAGWHVAAFGLACIMVGLVFAAISRRYWGSDRGEAVIAYLSSAYVNAGNLGIPLTAFLLGDAAWATSAILLQLLLLQPSAVAVLESSNGRGRSALGSAIRRPIVICALLGVVLNLTGWQPPALLWAPIEVLARAGIPAMLLAFGMGLHSRPLPRLDRLGAQALAAIATKVLILPAVTLGLGVAMGISGTPLRAAVLLAALPTAQVVFVHASRYGVGERLAQAVTLWSTVLCVPVMAAAALVAG